MSTLTKLEELKIEYRDLFRAAAPKVKRVDEACFYLRCPTVLNPKHFKFTWRGLRVAKQTCTRKTCPRTLLIRYLEMLDHTRSFRQCNDDAESRAFWRGVVSEWKGRLWIALGRRQ